MNNNREDTGTDYEVMRSRCSETSGGGRGGAGCELVAVGGRPDGAGVCSDNHLLLMPAKVVAVSGELVHWIFYRLAPRVSVTVSVWRAVGCTTAAAATDGTADGKCDEKEYELVGETELTPQQPLPLETELIRARTVSQSEHSIGKLEQRSLYTEQGETIRVEVGDILGVFYSQYALSGALACTSHRNLTKEETVGTLLSYDTCVSNDPSAASTTANSTGGRKTSLSTGSQSASSTPTCHTNISLSASPQPTCHTNSSQSASSSTCRTNSGTEALNQWQHLVDGQEEGGETVWKFKLYEDDICLGSRVSLNHGQEVQTCVALQAFVCPYEH